MSETSVSTPKEISAEGQKSDSESDPDPKLSGGHPPLIKNTRSNLDGAVVRELRTKAKDKTDEREQYSGNCFRCGGE